MFTVILLILLAVSYAGLFLLAREYKKLMDKFIDEVKREGKSHWYPVADSKENTIPTNFIPENPDIVPIEDSPIWDDKAKVEQSIKDYTNNLIKEAKKAGK